MTTGPDGRHLDAADRISEIHARYGPDDLVARWIAAATPDVMAAVRAVGCKLTDVRG